MKERQMLHQPPGMRNSDDRVPPEVNEISGHVVDACHAIHRQLGPGLLENAYEECLKYELMKRGLTVECQKPIPLKYGDVSLDAGYRADMIVGDRVIVELKAIDSILPIHRAQVHTYLKLAGCLLGLLINFNVKYIKDGIERIILPKPEPEKPD